MYKLSDLFSKKNPKILCLGAHPDDIEIGCSATLLKLVKNSSAANICWVVFSGNGERQKEALQSAQTLLKNLKSKKIILKNFKDGYFPFFGETIKDYFEEIKQAFNPDIIFTHYIKDAHQDHRLIGSLTWNTFRDNLIIEYEIPKYDGDFGVPNLYVNLDKSLVNEKIKTIIEGFPSQNGKRWFNKGTFIAIMNLRGVESNSPSKYAEAFYCRKISI